MAMRFNPRQLEAYRSVMNLGTMTAAANEMGVSQPAVSRLVSDLETDVGFRLFERVNNKLIPTHDGRKFFEHVECWYLGIDQIVSAAEKIRHSGLGGITMGAPTGLASGLMNHVVARFLANRPEVGFRLVAGSSDTTMKMVSRFQLDLGIVQMRPSTDTVSVLKLPDMAAICVLPAGHDLAQRAEIRVEDLEGQDLISLAPKSALRLRTDAALLNAGVSVNRRIEASISTSIFELVGLGFGIAVTNPFSIDQLGFYGLVSRPFVPALPYQIGIAVPRHRSRSGLINAFLEHLKTDFGHFANHQCLHEVS